jgi:hypothetical protein
VDIAIRVAPAARSAGAVAAQSWRFGDDVSSPSHLQLIEQFQAD